MDTRGEKRVIAVLVAALLLVGSATQAGAWGSATHVFIDDHLGAQGPLRNLNEIYGGMAPDVFNYLFDHPDLLQYLYVQTHYGYLKVWEEADTLLGKAAVYGF